MHAEVTSWPQDDLQPSDDGRARGGHTCTPSAPQEEAEPGDRSGDFGGAPVIASCEAGRQALATSGRSRAACTCAARRGWRVLGARPPLARIAGTGRTRKESQGPGPGRRPSAGGALLAHRDDGVDRGLGRRLLLPAAPKKSPPPRVTASQSHSRAELRTRAAVARPRPVAPALRHTIAVPCPGSMKPPGLAAAGAGGSLQARRTRRRRHCATPVVAARARRRASLVEHLDLLPASNSATRRSPRRPPRARRRCSPSSPAPRRSRRLQRTTPRRRQGERLST